MKRRNNMKAEKNWMSTATAKEHSAEKALNQ